jgi:hypothetical protein
MKNDKTYTFLYYEDKENLLIKPVNIHGSSLLDCARTFEEEYGFEVIVIYKHGSYK